MKKGIFSLLVASTLAFTACQKDNTLPNSGTLVVHTQVDGYSGIQSGMILKLYEGADTTGFLVDHSTTYSPLIMEYRERSSGTYTVVASWTNTIPNVGSQTYTDVATVYLPAHEAVTVDLVLQ